MSYRFMRVIVFFDLPSVTSQEKRMYTRFRKHLIKMGFIMLQQSVYAKLALNMTAAEVLMKNVRQHRPTEGVIQMLTITEKQFSKMEYVLGECSSNVIDTEERVVVL